MDDDEYDRRAPAQAAAASAWQFPPQSTQPSQPPSGFSMGRGRGRGRGVQSSQPLRRPNLPGMAAGAAATSQGEIYLFYLLSFYISTRFMISVKNPWDMYLKTNHFFSLIWDMHKFCPHIMLDAPTLPKQFCFTEKYLCGLKTTMINGGMILKIIRL